MPESDRRGFDRFALQFHDVRDTTTRSIWPPIVVTIRFMRRQLSANEGRYDYYTAPDYVIRFSDACFPCPVRACWSTRPIGRFRTSQLFPAAVLP